MIAWWVGLLIGAVALIIGALLMYAVVWLAFVGVIRRHL